MDKTRNKDNFERRKDPIKDLQDRMNFVAQWNERLDLLKIKRDITKTQFCESHGLHLPWLIRATNNEPVPRWSSIQKVERALEIEGV